jgi:hypothetical protein
MTRLALAASAALLAVFLCVPAAAQETPCASYSDMTTKLQQSHGEALKGRGIDMAGRMLEIWASADGWSILLVRPDNMLTCLMLVGQKGTSWQTVEPQPVGPKS